LSALSPSQVHTLFYFQSIKILLGPSEARLMR
jgi:hypothetical protein